MGLSADGFLAERDKRGAGDLWYFADALLVSARD